MKKLLIVVAIVMLFNLLTGCEFLSNLGTSYNIYIVKETYTESNAVIDVFVNKDNVSKEALIEIANKVANEVYINNFDDLKDKQSELQINLYVDETDYDNNTISYGSLIFYINQSEDNPGLSIKTNNIKENS